MINIVSANSADHDEMPHNAAFHLGLHCLPKYQFRASGQQKVKVYEWKFKVSKILNLR